MAFLTQGSITLGVNTFSEFIPRRFALKFDPPTIVLEYLIPTNGKLYMHNMKLHREELSESAENLYQKLLKKHKYYLDPSQISESQIVDLITHLQKACTENRNFCNINT